MLQSYISHSVLLYKKQRGKTEHEAYNILYSYISTWSYLVLCSWPVMVITDRQSIIRSLNFCHRKMNALIAEEALMHFVPA